MGQTKELSIRQKSVEEYLSEREVTHSDVLLLVHPFTTGRAQLTTRKYFFNMLRLIVAFGNRGGKIFEVKGDYTASAEQFFEHFHLTQPSGIQSFSSSEMGWVPYIGENRFIDAVADEISPEGRVLIAGAFLWDSGLESNDEPYGCVGQTWHAFQKRGISAHILRDFSFQFNSDVPYGKFNPDALTSLKPSKSYQGCI